MRKEMSKLQKNTSGIKDTTNHQSLFAVRHKDFSFE